MRSFPSATIINHSEETPMRKVLYVLYQPYKWLIFIPYLTVSTLFFGFLTILMVPLAGARIASYICGSIWSRLNGYMTPIRVSVKGRENIDKRQSYVIVSNHQSHYDVFVLYGWLSVDFKWVMKHELRKVPGLGIGCEKVGHIFIDRSNHERALASLRDAKKKIVNGTSVIFFPEGTRSRDGSVGEFKKGAFKMALDLELPLLPITISGTGKILPTNTMALFPGRARVTIHPPMSIEGYNDDNLGELMARAREVIVSGLERS
ncbi:MAG TPA: lysophospholipid acyltransferase family protein [Spirochaetota bacterium]|nr:lysophospholipid acyltransferase family protein [Spirochaetota bacterium]